MAAPHAGFRAHGPIPKFSTSLPSTALGESIIWQYAIISTMHTNNAQAILASSHILGLYSSIFEKITHLNSDCCWKRAIYKMISIRITGSSCKSNGIIRSHARENEIKIKFSGTFDDCIHESDAVLVIDPYDEATRNASPKKAYCLAKYLKKPLCDAQNPDEIAKFCAHNDVKTLFIVPIMAKNVKYETYLDSFAGELFAKLCGKINCSHCNRVLYEGRNFVGQGFNNCYKCEDDISRFLEHLLATPLSDM